MPDIEISAEDQERIDAMVEQYRHSLTNLYKMAYLAGSIEQARRMPGMVRKELGC